MTLKYVFDEGGSNELTINEDAILSHNPVKTHSGKGDFQATLAVPFSKLKDHAQRQDRVNIKVDGSVIFTGYLINNRHNDGSATTSISGDGIAKKLEETAPDYSNGPVTYSNIKLSSVIDDYWNKTPFSNHSVTTQNTSQVANDEQVQTLSSNADWNGAVSIPADKPFAVQNNRLELLQSSFVQEGENPDNISSPSVINVADYSDGSALQPSTDTTYKYNFTPQYDIPESDVKITIRDQVVDSDDTTDKITIKFNGETVDTINTTDSALQWRDLEGSYSGGDLSGGTTYTFEIVVDANASSANDYRADLVHVADNQYNYDYDNSIGSNETYLESPQLYPTGATLSFDGVDVSYNITGARIDSTWKDSDVSKDQAIELSNDDSNYITTNNSETADVSFSSSIGRTLYQRVTFDRYGSRSTATPKTGYKGQAIDTWDAYTDGDDLAVIDNLELTRNHFDNLKILHNQGDYLWTIEHDSSSISNLTVKSYPRGRETQTQPAGFDDEINQSPEIISGNYFNSVTVQGGEDSNGDRPIATVKDSTAINNDGREISPGILRDPKITTEDGATFLARTLLSAAQKNDQIRGSVTVPPNEFANPGYSYPVDFTGDGTTNDKVAEEVSLTESTDNVQIRYNFSPQIDLSAQLSELRQNSRDISDRV